MKKISVIIILIISGSIVNAQDINKAYSLLQKKKYELAYQECVKLHQAKKNTLEMNYCLAQLLSIKTFNRYNPNKSFKLATELSVSISEISTLKKQNLRKKYNLDSINLLKLKNKIALQEKNKVNINSIQSLNQFIKLYPKTETAVEFELLLHDIEYKKCLDDNTYNSFKAFKNKYPHSKYIKNINKKLDVLVINKFKEYTFDGELLSIEAFLKQHPEFLNSELVINEKKLALQYKSININSQINDSIREICNDYIKKAAPKSSALLILQYMIENYIKNFKWTLAIKKVKQYESYFTENKAYNNLLSLLYRKDTVINISPLSDSINSVIGDEYAPFLAYNQDIIFFCAKNRINNIGYEDIFYSKKMRDTMWSYAVPIDGINTSFDNEAPLSISTDLNILYYYTGGDIYRGEYNGTKWTKGYKLPVINQSDSWEGDAVIAADGTAILFSSDRENNIGRRVEVGEKFHGGFWGNTDIYISIIKNNKYQKPINLGDIINTPFCERSPYLHPDMKTLYFASNGHGGLGDLDIYMTKRLSDTSWTKWSDPINVGKYINSANADYEFKINTNGDLAYFSRNTTDNYNIYTFNLPQDFKPEKVAKISGKIHDKSGKSIQATIFWENIETGKTIGSLNSDSKGNYFIVLPWNKNYGYYVLKKGYYPISENINLKNKDFKADIKKDFILYSVEDLISQRINLRINNLFFEFNQATLKKESFPELNRLLYFLKTNSEINITLLGHTDNVGNEQYNQKLSESRALAVKNYLVKYGCDSNRIKTKGYGSKKPIEDNNTEKGRKLNRRVEFNLEKK